jgi:hypothetical protein
MGLLKRKTDPISDRTKALNAQIAALEAQIKKLDGKLQQAPAPTQRRAAALPATPAGENRRHTARTTREPIFEKVDHRRLEAATDEAVPVDHFNDLGVRKYDLAAAWRRLRGQFRGPPTPNPKLVTYLAAGSIRGLRPLRYEKRVARNRFIFLFLLLMGLLWGIIFTFLRN